MVKCRRIFLPILQCQLLLFCCGSKLFLSIISRFYISRAANQTEPLLKNIHLRFLPNLIVLTKMQEIYFAETFAYAALFSKLDSHIDYEVLWCNAHAQISSSPSFWMMQACILHLLRRLFKCFESPLSNMIYKKPHTKGSFYLLRILSTCSQLGVYTTCKNEQRVSFQCIVESF